MVTEKRNGKGRKGPTPKRCLTAFTSLVILTVFSGALLYLARPTHSGASAPVYEESPSAPTDLSPEIAKVDRCIYESLFVEGVPERNVLFTTVEPREEQGLEWEFTEMLIRVPEASVAVRVEESIRRAVSALEPGVKHRKERLAGRETVWHVFTLGCYTHRIRVAVEERPEEPETRPPPRIAIVIDDLGYDLAIARAFMQLDIPVSLSVLPSAPHAPLIAQETQEKGYEVLLHLPMEAKRSHRVSMGPGGLTTRMNEDTVRETLRGHFSRIPGVRGVNNHMGSKYTEMEEGMAVVFSELKARGLFYLDSRTTPRSVATVLGKRMGVPVVTRSVFLDNQQSSAALRFQMDRLLGMARHANYAVGIGHPHRGTLRSLKENLPRLKSEAQFVPVSELAPGLHGMPVTRHP
jgi:uncharacterized protein